jgi:hypothetical protein
MSHRSVVSLALTAAIAVAAAPARAAVTGAQVKKAVERGVAYLKASQLNNGRWADYGNYEGGPTALAVLALATAGLSKDDPAVRAGLIALSAVPNERTYVVALKAMAFAAADPAGYKGHLQVCVDDLIRWQNDDGTWTYGSPTRFRYHGDNSNTQFALLALHEAARAGAKVPPQAYEKSDRWFRNSQNELNGGWPYPRATGKATGTMTAVGVASLFITGGALHHGREKGYVNGAAPGCGEYLQDKNIVAGLEWLARNFDRNAPPGGELQYLYYWYYAFERVGVLAGMRYFGEHDWFRLGAERLVGLQKDDGSWPGYFYNTPFAVLFLVKGRLPAAINKLRRPGRWNLDQDDAKNLCIFANANKVFPEAVGWQAVSVNAPLEQWLEAPLLYFNGHTFPEFTPEQAAKIRKFVEAGGTIFAEACCSRPEFDAGFQAFCKKHFPEYALARLDASHPVYHARYKFGENPPPLFGLDLACRTSILYSPRDLSCLWQQAAVGDPELKDATIRAFQLGANIMVYAAGERPLRDKVEIVQAPEAVREPDRKTVRGAVHIAQLMHGGDWKPDPRAVANLAGLLRDQAGLDVVAGGEPIRLGEGRLFNHPVVFLTGHHRFELTAAEKNELRQYLGRGGFLFAEACCGRASFDEGLRALVKELFPKGEFKQVNADHPLIRGGGGGGAGYDLRRLRYKPRVTAESPRLDTPVLWLLEVDKRPAIVYSPYSLGCSIEGHICGNCRGVLGRADDKDKELSDAEKLAINIVLYGLGS